MWFKSLVKYGNRSSEGASDQPVQLLALEPGTCSYRASLYWLSWGRAAAPFKVPKYDQQITVVDSFLEAGQKLENTVSEGGERYQRTMVFVPHIHRAAALHSLNGRLRMLPEYSFALENPRLWLVKRRGNSVNYQSAVISGIPALWGLLPSAFAENRRVEALSTQDSARMVRESVVDIGIVNQHALESNSALEEVESLRHLTVMWLAFAAS